MARFYSPPSILGAIWRTLWYRLFPRRVLRSAEHRALLQYSHFYTQLSEAGKARFIRRVISFMSIKEFIPGGDYRIHAEVPVIIAGIYIQITWGLKKYSLEKFSRFQVFEDTFISKRNQKPYAAMLSSRDTISIGVKPLLYGILNSTDGFHPGMAILVKAMEIDLLYGTIYDYHLADYYEKWKAVADLHREKLGQIYPEIDQWNIEVTNRELLSISIVRFFERPAHLEESLPAIYQSLCVMLNIDPYNSRGTDFLLDKKLALEKGVKRVSLRKEFRITRKEGLRYLPWVLPWAITGVLGGLIWAYLNFTDTLISLWQLLAISSVMGALVFYPLWKWFALRKNISYHQVLLFCVLFVLPVGSALFLQVNRITPGRAYEEKYAIVSYRMYYRNRNYGIPESVTYILSDNKIPERMRSFRQEGIIENPRSAVFIFKKGLLGFPVLQDVRIE